MGDRRAVDGAHCSSLDHFARQAAVGSYSPIHRQDARSTGKQSPQPDPSGLRRTFRPNVDAIERHVRQIQPLLCKAAARTADKLRNMVASPLDTSSPVDRGNHITHPPYATARGALQVFGSAM